MNHHSFRELVKNMPAKDIKKNRMNPAHFKAVCFVLSMYGDYESGTRVRPSWLTVSREAGVDRKTGMKVRDYLLSNGIMKKVGTTEGNISIYEFLDQLSNSTVQLSNSSIQLSSIDGQNTTYNIKENSTVNTQEKERVEDFLEEVFS